MTSFVEVSHFFVPCKNYLLHNQDLHCHRPTGLFLVLHFTVRPSMRLEIGFDISDHNLHWCFLGALIATPTHFHRDTTILPYPITFYHIPPYRTLSHHILYYSGILGSGSIPHTPLCVSPIETPTSTSPIPYTTSLSTSFTTSLSSPFSSSSPISLNMKTKNETDCEDERDRNEHLYDRFDKSHSSEKDFRNCDSKIGETVRSDKIENMDNNISDSNYNDGNGGNSDSDTIDNDNDNDNSDIDSIIRMTENVRLSSSVENTDTTIANNGNDDVNSYSSTGTINGKSEKNKKKKGQENNIISSEQLVLHTAHHSSLSLSDLTDVPILPTAPGLSFPDGTHNTTLSSSQSRRPSTQPSTLPSTAQNTTTISTSSSSSSLSSSSSSNSTSTSSRANKRYLDGCVWGKKGKCNT